MNPLKAIDVVLAAVLLVCPVLADTMTLHAGKVTLTNAKVLRREQHRIIIGHQAGVGTFELAEFPETEQLLIFKALELNGDDYAKELEQTEEQAAYDAAQEAKGLVKRGDKWGKKAKCRVCGGNGSLIVTRAATTVWEDDVSGPMNASGTAFLGQRRVTLPASTYSHACSSCGGKGYILIGEDGSVLPLETDSKNSDKPNTSTASAPPSTPPPSSTKPARYVKVRCSICNGKGESPGLVHPLKCFTCKGTGYRVYKVRTEPEPPRSAAKTASASARPAAKVSSSSQQKDFGHVNPWGNAGERVVGEYSTKGTAEQNLAALERAMRDKTGRAGLVNANMDALGEQVSNAGDAVMTIQRPPEYRIDYDREKDAWLLIERRF